VEALQSLKEIVEAIMRELPEAQKYERQVTAPERLFSRSPFSIVTMVVRIRGSVSPEALRHAVDTVQRRHTLLSVRIKEDEYHALWFTSEEVDQIPIKTIVRNDEDDWIEVHQQTTKVPYEFATRPAIRFILLQAPDRCEVIIQCHHIICDGMSLAYLARDLMGHLGNPTHEVKPLPTPEPITLHNLPEDISQSALRKMLIRRMNRKWTEACTYFDDRDYQVLNQAYWDNFHHGLFAVELSEAETTSLAARCRSEQVTVNSALTTAFNGAQSFVEGRKSYHDRTVIAASLRDRIPISPGEGMGFYAGALDLKLKYNHTRSFWENARNFHGKIRANLSNSSLFGEFLDWLYLEPSLLEAINFKKLGVLVRADSDRYEKLSDFGRRDDVVLKVLKREKMASLQTKLLGTAITNLGRLDFPRRYGALELDRLIVPPGGAFPLAQVNLVLGAVTCSGKLSLTLRFVEEAVEIDKMAAIKDRALAYLLMDG
jgi:NRPS condensation-like uncharacterized protein